MITPKTGCIKTNVFYQVPEIKGVKCIVAAVHIKACTKT